MPVVIEAIERFGRKDAFESIGRISQLRQSESTIRWAVDEWKKLAKLNDEDPIGRRGLEVLIANAPILGWFNRLSVKSSNLRTRLPSSSRVANWWPALGAGDALACVEAACEDDDADSQWTEGSDLVDLLGLQGVRHVDRMMEILRREPDAEDAPAIWMEIFAVRLAGELRHEPAVPLLVLKFRRDLDFLSEELERALSKIGGDETVRAIRADFTQADLPLRIYGGAVLGHVRSDSAVKAAQSSCGRKNPIRPFGNGSNWAWSASSPRKPMRSPDRRCSGIRCPKGFRCTISSTTS